MPLEVGNFGKDELQLNLKNLNLIIDAYEKIPMPSQDDLMELVEKNKKFIADNDIHYFQEIADKPLTKEEVIVELKKLRKLIPEYKKVKVNVPPKKTQNIIGGLVVIAVLTILSYSNYDKLHQWNKERIAQNTEENKRERQKTIDILRKQGYVPFEEGSEEDIKHDALIEYFENTKVLELTDGRKLRKLGNCDYATETIDGKILNLKFEYKDNIHVYSVNEIEFDTGLKEGSTNTNASISSEELKKPFSNPELIMNKIDFSGVVTEE